MFVIVRHHFVRPVETYLWSSETNREGTVGIISIRMDNKGSEINGESKRACRTLRWHNEEDRNRGKGEKQYPIQKTLERRVPYEALCEPLSAVR